jgi:hypothetical protein
MSLEAYIAIAAIIPFAVVGLAVAIDAFRR